MKVVIATDSFKGSLSTIQAGNAISEGIKRVFSDVETSVHPIADGGEGTVEAMSTIAGSKKQSVKVCGPLNQKVDAEYVIIENTAVIEMSAAAGITLIKKE